MYICLCKSVTDHQIRDAVELGATRLCDLSRGLGVATGCGRCAESAQRVLDEALATRAACRHDHETVDQAA